MFQSKRDPERKFGSVYRQKRFDSYEDGAQPGETNDNEHATSQAAGSSAEDVAKAHGPAHMVTYSHNHETGEHKVSSSHPDGHTHESVHSDAAQAYEEGGKLAYSDVKRRDHPDQQGSESEEMNFEAPETA